MMNWKKVSKVHRMLRQLPNVNAYRTLSVLVEAGRPMTVTEIQNAVSEKYGMDYRQDQTSMGLIYLRRGKVVKWRRDGKYRWYEADPVGIGRINRALKTFNNQTKQTNETT